MKPRRKTMWIAALLAAVLLIIGCSGIEPYTPRNNREEGPEQGLFSGAEGEFIIYRKTDEPKTGGEEEEQEEEREEEKEKKEEEKAR